MAQNYNFASLFVVFASFTQLIHCESKIQQDAFVMDAAILPRGGGFSSSDSESAFVSNKTLMERQYTCPAGYGLCPNSNLCAQIGGRCCDDGQHTCNAGYVCCGSGCRFPSDLCCSNVIDTGYHVCDGTAACCGSQCMYVGSTCCPNVSNNDRHGCLAGQNCCGDYCSPISGQCCKTGYYCPSGTWCVLYQGVQRCCDGLGCLGDYNPSYATVPPRPASATVVPGAAPNSAANSSPIAAGSPAVSSPPVVSSLSGAGGGITGGSGGGTSGPATSYYNPTTTSSSTSTSPTPHYYTYTLTLSVPYFIYTASGPNTYYGGTTGVLQTSTVSFYATNSADGSFSATLWAISHMTAGSTIVTVSAASTTSSPTTGATSGRLASAGAAARLEMQPLWYLWICSVLVLVLAVFL